jgi:hypothetical protein
LFELYLAEKLLQTKTTPFADRLWREFSGAGHLGSLTKIVAQFTEEIDRRTFNFADAPRMNLRLYMGVPFTAQISKPCTEYFECVMDV